MVLKYFFLFRFNIFPSEYIFTTAVGLSRLGGWGWLRVKCTCVSKTTHSIHLNPSCSLSNTQHVSMTCFGESDIVAFNNSHISYVHSIVCGQWRWGLSFKGHILHKCAFHQVLCAFPQHTFNIWCWNGFFLCRFHIFTSWYISKSAVGLSRLGGWGRLRVKCTSAL